MEKNTIEKALPELYKFLTERADVEKIFCLAHQTGNPAYYDLMIVMPKKSFSESMEMMMAMELATVDLQNVTGTICQAEYLHKRLREGQIYYSLACNERTLIYKNSDWKIVELDKALKKKVKDKAYPVFYNGLKKARAFWAIAKVHQEHNKGMAAFMLHQAAEICLHALMKSLTGRAKYTHYLEEQLLYTYRYTDQLPLLFLDGNDENQRLLDLLNNAYEDFRYNDQFEIKTKDLSLCLNKIDRLHEIAEQTFLDWVKRYELI